MTEYHSITLPDFYSIPPRLHSSAVSRYSIFTLCEGEAPYRIEYALLCTLFVPSQSCCRAREGLCLGCTALLKD